MRIIRHPRRKSLKGSVVALGTFDGVHRGHQKVIKSAVRYAKKIGAASLAITFDPHPQRLIVPERGLRLLTILKERENLFCGYGVDGVVVIRFRKQLQKLSSEDFVKKYLVGKLGVKKVFVGFDYAFGRGRSGNVSHLKDLGKKYGFEVEVIPPVKANGHIIKSGTIRELIGAGKFSKALRLLGHAYQISGKVVRAHGRGRLMGFSTANLKVNARKLVPLQGVYAGETLGKKCAVNIGTRPTFGAGKVSIEVHILNFRKDIHGKTITVDLTRRIRDEMQFSDVEKLKKQLRKDIGRIKLL
jgi:riboflavin kinase/FMN adenylyltransferase